MIFYKKKKREKKLKKYIAGTLAIMMIAGIIVLVIVGLGISGYCLKKNSEKENEPIKNPEYFHKVIGVVEEVIDKEHVLIKVMDSFSGETEEKLVYDSGEKVILHYESLSASCNMIEKKDINQLGEQPQKGDIIKTIYTKEEKKEQQYNSLLCENIELWEIKQERFDKMGG